MEARLPANVVVRSRTRRPSNGRAAGVSLAVMNVHCHSPGERQSAKRANDLRHADILILVGGRSTGVVRSESDLAATTPSTVGVTAERDNESWRCATQREPLVIFEVEDRIATVTLNRPAARNALNRALMYALWDSVLQAGDDAGVDAVVLTGSDPAFSAGVDLKEVAGEEPPSAEPRGPRQGPERDTNGLFRFLPVIEKPVIGAVNGVAVTGGLEIALQCTFLVASERARFADTHARVGIMPGGGITVLMAQSIGLRRAIELSLTGNFLTADDALRYGMVNHVVPHDELLPFAKRLAGDIVNNDQTGVRRLLSHYKAMANAATLDEAHLIEGYMAETWPLGAGQVSERRGDVMARGRSQTS